LHLFINPEETLIDCFPKNAGETVHTTSCPFEGAIFRLGGDEALFRELIGYFEEDAPMLSATLHAALAANDRDGVMRAAHSLRSLVASFDALKPMTNCGNIEQTASGGDLRPVADSLAHLDDEIRLLTDELRTYLAESRPPPSP
jgi:HPt (histidine-containing phosphotransfer) domain-containing protein